MAYNPKSLENLKPYRRGEYSPSRQIGRKKGSINRKTLLKQMMESKLDPNELLGDMAQRLGEKAKGKTVYEAIILALINGAMNLDVKSANTLIKLISKIDDEESHKPIWEKDNKIEIEIINPPDDWGAI